MQEPIAVAIVHACDGMRAGLRVLVEHSGMQVALAVANLDELEEKPATTPRMDVALLELELPVQRTLDGMAHIHDLYPSVGVLLLGEITAPVARQAVAAGAKGLLGPRLVSSELLQALRSVAAGGLHDNQWLRQGMGAHGSKEQKAEQRMFRLSELQEKVLRGIAKGRTNKEIAERLDMNVRTVDSIRDKLLDLFGVDNRAALAREATLRRAI